jgi:hypothetical protein
MLRKAYFLRRGSWLRPESWTPRSQNLLSMMNWPIEKFCASSYLPTYIILVLLAIVFKIYPMEGDKKLTNKLKFALKIKVGISQKNVE